MPNTKDTQNCGLKKQHYPFENSNRSHGKIVSCSQSEHTDVSGSCSCKVKARTECYMLYIDSITEVNLQYFPRLSFRIRNFFFLFNKHNKIMKYVNYILLSMYVRSHLIFFVLIHFLGFTS